MFAPLQLGIAPAMLSASDQSIYTVLLRKSAHGRCILLSHQTGGSALFRVFPHSTLKERPPLFTYTSSAIAAIEQQARVSQSPPSTSTSLESLATSPLTTSSSLPPSAGWGPAWRPRRGRRQHRQARQHMDTIDTDTQTNRDLLQGGSYLRYAGTSH